MAFEDLATKMDAQVDIRLGDSIMYSRDGGGSYARVMGWVIDADLGSDDAPVGLDMMARRKRVKLAITTVAAPDRNHRIQAAKLGPGVFRPLNNKLRVAGRYNIFDVEKVT